MNSNYRHYTSTTITPEDVKEQFEDQNDPKIQEVLHFMKRLKKINGVKTVAIVYTEDDIPNIAQQLNTVTHSAFVTMVILDILLQRELVVDETDEVTEDDLQLDSFPANLVDIIFEPENTSS